jgi:hypothetical protein
MRGSANAGSASAANRRRVSVLPQGDSLGISRTGKKSLVLDTAFNETG